MKKVILTLSASILSGALLFNHGVAEASVDKDVIKKDAIQKVSAKFGYKENGLVSTGEIEETADYYKIPTVQSTGVGGLKIIKVNKTTGTVQFGDNDLKNYEDAGTLNLDKYNIEEN